MGETSHKLRALPAPLGALAARESTGFENLFRRAVRLNPLNAETHFGVGMYYLLNWDSFSKAERSFGKDVFRRAVKLGPYLIRVAKSKFRRKKGVNPSPEVLQFLSLEGALVN